MKKIVNSLFGVISLIGVCAVVAGIVDRRDLECKEQKATLEGRYVHKPYGLYEKYMKRPLDFFLSSVALIVLSPMMIVIALLVKLKLGSPIIFKQERPGRDEKIFKIYKFRTMTDQRDIQGNLLPDCDRLTFFGAWLRKTSLDELPELFNIVCSDMSLIGPRPLLKEYIPFYTDSEKHRHDVRPGLSGLAQVKGRNSLKWDDRLAYDVQYVDRITFTEDVKIVIKTLLKVLKSEDVAVDTNIVETYLNLERNEEL